MSSINDLIVLIDKEIRTLEDLEFKLKNDIQILNSIIENLNNQGIVNINIEDSDFLKLALSGVSGLSEKEKKFLDTWVNMPDILKKSIVDIGFDKDQSALLLNIKRRLILYREELLQKKESGLEDLNELSKTLKDKNNLATNLDLINLIFEKNNISNDDQIKILILINEFNIGVYKKKLNGEIEKFEEEKLFDDKVISEEDLDITNLEYEKLKQLFIKYDINLDEFKEKFKQNLLKYGNYEKINVILQYMSEQNLKFLFKNQEILTRILLVSNVEILRDVINVCNKYEIADLIRTCPTIFFPPMFQFEKVNSKPKKNINTDDVCGSYRNFKANIEIFEKLNIPIKYVYDKCQTALTFNTKMLNLSLSLLNLYGVEKKDLMKALTVLRVGETLARRFDIAIEGGIYDYCVKNLSRARENTVNLYRVKYAKKINDEYKDNEILKRNSGLVLPFEIINPKEEKYGKKKEDTFKLYNAVLLNIDDGEEYDEILQKSSNNIISQGTLNSFVISTFDNLYKTKEYEYNFNGVIISRIKVLRYFETLVINEKKEVNNDLMMYIITKDSMLDQEEINILKECIAQLDLQYSRRK